MNNDKPLFSFIIPNYNYGKYIRECIDSCIAQKVDAEIIVVDGGSTDDTVNILESYGEQIRWVSEKDKGQSDAINKGVNMAKGDYIAWINSDDYYENGDAFRQIEAHVRAYPETDIIYGNLRYVTQDGTFYKYRKHTNRINLKSIYLSPFEGIVQPELIFRRNLFLKVGGVDLNYHYSMDFDLWVRMFSETDQIHHVDDVLTCARIHSDAKTQAFILNSIRETIKAQTIHKSRINLNAADKLTLTYKRAKTWLYYASVKLKLHQLARISNN